MLSILTLRIALLSLGAGAVLAQDGLPQASSYLDGNTGINFLGWADGTGFQFGMVLPADPSTSKDFIAQLVAPLTSGGGWGAVDFGSSMTNHLMIATWPNGDNVIISPRIATGYEIDNGANVYAANPVQLTPIPKGTFVNQTHVTATFICGGCINGDSFTVGGTTASTFAYAYAKTPVATPSDANTQLSDHTAKGEPYGPFQVAVQNAQSDQYVMWAAMTQADTPASTTGDTGAASTATPNATSVASKPTGSSGSSGGGAASTTSTPATTDVADSPTLGSGGIAALTLVGIIYILQALNLC